MAERSELASGLREGVAGGWIDFRTLLADRRRILERPERMLRPSPELAFTPFKFGSLLWVAYPTTIVALVLAICGLVWVPPDSQATLKLAALQSMRDELRAVAGTPPAIEASEAMREKARAALDAISAVSGAMTPDGRDEARAEFTRALAALAASPGDVPPDGVRRRIDHILEHRLLEARLGKRLEDSGALQALATALVGAAVLLNVWLFRWLIRRRSDGLPHADQADRVMLYYLPARQLGLLAAMLVVGIVANVALRYGQVQVALAGMALNFVLTAGAFVHYLWCAWPMTRVLAGGSAEKPLVRRVQRRLLGSLLLAMLAWLVVGAIVGAVAGLANTAYIHARYGKY